MTAVRVFYYIASPTHRHPAHPVSVPIRHPRETTKKLCAAVTDFEPDTYIAKQAARCIAYGILMHVASGLFPWGTAAGHLA